MKRLFLGKTSFCGKKMFSSTVFLNNEKKKETGAVGYVYKDYQSEVTAAISRVYKEKEGKKMGDEEVNSRVNKAVSGVLSKHARVIQKGKTSEKPTRSDVVVLKRDF